MADHHVTLTATGETQCLELGKKLAQHINQPVAIWTSPYTRARQTTQLFSRGLAHLGLSHFEDPRIREQDWGNYYTKDQHQEIISGLDGHSRFFYRIPSGESGADVFNRVSQFFASLERKNTHETVLISTHGMTAMIALMVLLESSYETYEQSAWFNNCGFVQLEQQAGGAYQITLDNRATTE